MTAVNVIAVWRQFRHCENSGMVHEEWLFAGRHQSSSPRNDSEQERAQHCN